MAMHCSMRQSIGHSKIAQGTGVGFKFYSIDKLALPHEDCDEISHLTKCDAFRGEQTPSYRP